MSEDVLFLDRSAVVACMTDIDPCAVVERVLRLQARGRTTLPAEGYLPWTNSEGAYCRSLAMLGAVQSDDGPPVLGVKLINAATSNPAHGRERAGGIGLIFDPETARPLLLAEAGWVSATRTAAYTMVSLDHLGPRRWDAMALIGCGTLARAHLDLLARSFPAVHTVHLHDLAPARAEALARWVRQAHPGLTVRVREVARDAVADAAVVVTTTTTDRGYLPADWLAPGTFVAHVSLDDLLPDAFSTAQGLFVDDVDLVVDNPRRILGRMMREGRIVARSAAGDAGDSDDVRVDGARALDGTLGQVLVGECAAVRPTTGHVISNPFGMSVLDVGLLGEIHRVAVAQGRGRVLTLY